MEEIEKILVLVKMKDGTIRQVISNQSQKELALRMMIGEDGKIHLNHTPELGISF